MPPALLRHPQQQLAYAKSKHGYAAQNLDELDFPKGALLQIINQRDNDWWEGIYNQKQGWLPSSYVKLLKVRSKSVDNKLGGVPNSKAELLEKRKSKDDTSFGVKPKNDSFGSPNTRSSRSPSTWNPNAKYSLNGSALSGIQNGSQNGANNGTPTPTSSLNSSPTQTSRYIYSSVQTQKKYATIAEKYDSKKNHTLNQSDILRELLASEKHIIHMLQLVSSQLDKYLQKQQNSSKNNKPLNELNSLKLLTDKLTKFHENNHKSLLKNDPGEHLLSQMKNFREFYENYLVPNYAVCVDNFRQNPQIRKLISQNELNDIITKLSKASIKRLDNYNKFYDELSRFTKIDESFKIDDTAEEVLEADATDGQKLHLACNQLKSLHKHCMKLQKVKENVINIGAAVIRGWEGGEVTHLARDAIYMSLVSIQKTDYASQQYYLILLKGELVRLSLSSRLSAYTYEGRIDLQLLEIARHSQTSFSIESKHLDKLILFCENSEICDEWIAHLIPKEKVRLKHVAHSENTVKNGDSEENYLKKNNASRNQLPAPGTLTSPTRSPVKQVANNQLSSTKTAKRSEPSDLSVLQDGCQLVSIRIPKKTRKPNSPNSKNKMSKFYIVPHTDTEVKTEVKKEVRKIGDGQPELHQFVSNYLDYSKKTVNKIEYGGKMMGGSRLLSSPRVSSGFNSSDLPTPPGLNCSPAPPPLNNAERVELDQLREEVKELRVLKDKFKNLLH